MAANINAQTSGALTPLGITTMNANIIYGAITVPATTFYDDSADTARVNIATSDPIDTLVTDTKATWNMPTEADTYADVPRLSPADTLGWVTYSPHVGGTAGGYGRFEKNLDITMASIVDNFATTVAAGVAIIGATALSF